MDSTSTSTTCPHCGIDTGIARRGGLTLPGAIRSHEFEVMVRNEWRRRLGPEAYDRSHEVRTIGTLIRIALAEPGADAEDELTDEIDQLVADLAATGRGRAAVRFEVGQLLQSMRFVLERAEADPAACETFVEGARASLDRALEYPDAASAADAPDPTR